MARRFNTTGPCLPAKHYMLEPERRCPGVGELIDQEHFFVIHAPRQSGKTTLLRTLAERINAAGQYHALYCSLEIVQGLDDLKRGMAAILDGLQFALKYHPGLRGSLPDYLRDSSDSTLVRAWLTDLAAAATRPVVVFFDEADCLGGETLISFLRQLRDGYINRPTIPFPHSVVLVGMRNIRDFRVQVRPETQTLGSASPFNIAKAALTLSNFSRDEVGALYQQHTDDTSQVFPSEVVDYVWDMTRGQPWLVNAIAAEMVEALGQRDPGFPLTVAAAEEAIQRIILRCDTHIDSLLARLEEPRVRQIIEPVLLGEGESIQRASNDYQFVRDLGLIRDDQGQLSIANPIYNEVIARTLNGSLQLSLERTLIHRWMDGRTLDLSALLRAFQEFWRDHSEAWIGRFDYKEAAPHLILMGFLQRVVNGGARLDREFATGTRRVDLCVHYAGRRYPVELKLVRGAKTREEGLAQLARYMDTLGATEGWLVLFDRQSGRSWDKRLTWETVAQDGRTIHVVGA